ncbi:Histidine kinase-like ATPase domain-containing protein [Verrucomicrobium sp. GAS474]|uniref:response regulator n=1 Tax=Verrucomicrobium sp. GAS474 TaxID=1882831 RepID=UPI00087CAFD7|nr:response regulator [Verrucomicrobium sp. GAS474]SDT89626.1 Histidine kinase-like ATPase domain-containing protein [Verrucomicrobium sp. GAS474]
MPDTPSALPRPVVLVVDDDEPTLLLFSRNLTKIGCEAHTAVGGRAAQQFMQERGTAGLDCVITDYRMPGVSGLDLLQWIQDRDDTLATIVVTAEGEKSLIAASLRGGAVDFLEKPVSREQLGKSIRAAAETTTERRRARSNEEAIREVSRLQSHLLGPAYSPEQHGRPPAEIVIHTRSDVGGDFSTHIPTDDGRHVFFCGDVSGHDLKAGFVSAYFQGVVRALAAQGTPIKEIAHTFNDMLLREWSRPASDGIGVGFSLACTFLVTDPKRREYLLHNYGFPPATWSDAAGRLTSIADLRPPLGWFDALDPNETRLPLDTPAGDPALHSLCLYSDGLEDLAEALDVDPRCLLHRLLNPKLEVENKELIRRGHDDILILRTSPPDIADPFFPLLLEHHAGDRAADIDLLQKRWERSLALALGTLPKGRLGDILLCCREMVLNAMKHGSQGRKESLSSLHIAWQPRPPAAASGAASAPLSPAREGGRLRLRVEDTGAGHNFDIHRRIEELDQLREKHLGLSMVRLLCDRMTMERQGAILILDFDIDPTP